jgi:hypothetical protein
LVLDEKELARLTPWHWREVAKINHCLQVLRPVTGDLRRSIPSGEAAQMLVRNRAIRMRAHRWAVEQFMKEWELSRSLNPTWVSNLSDYVAEPAGFDALRRLNTKTANAVRAANESPEIAQDAARLALVVRRAGNGHLGVDRIVNYLRNRGHYTLTTAQYARLRSAVVDRIEGYLDLWQAGRLPNLDATTTTTTTT